MAKKNNIRSIRFSDELAELIEAQVGRNFSEKFENLVTRCVWELPAAERKLADIDEQIIEKRKQLGRMSDKADAMRRYLDDIEINLKKLSIAAARAQEHEW